MSAQTMSSVQLLSCSEADFDNSIKSMAVKDLMGLISSLQKEMAKEQEHFNSLSSALQALKDRKSRQYKSISADMVKAQGRLTMLMNRSMKCFSQQNLQPNKQEVQVRRRSSLKSADSPNTSPTKSASVQRSRSMHVVKLTSDGDGSPLSPASTQPSSASSEKQEKGDSALSKRVEPALRPTSVAGVNGVVSETKKSSESRVSLGYTPGMTSSSSLTSLNVQPQLRVMGPESSGGQRRPRSKSQILITPSPASSRLVPITASPQSASSPLTHASSQPSLDASSSHGQDPPASSQEKGFAGLPSVRQLAQTFGGKSTSGQSNSTHAATNYRPIIRAKSMAASDVSRRPNMTRSSDSSKVNGVPTVTGIGGRLQGQYVKRTPAPKPPGNSITNTANGQTELERVQARLRATGMSNSNTGMQNGDREVSVFKTNLDRKKSSSSILLGQKTDFDGDGDSRGLGLSVAQPSPEPQLGTMRRAQSREELYAIESRTRVQKDAMLKEIGNRKAATTAADEKESYTPITGQWGLKGSNLLAQRLQQDEARAEQNVTSKTQDGGRESAKVSMQMHPSLPNGRGPGGGGGGGGLAISIRSTSRENLAESSLSTQKLSNSTPRGSKPSSAPAPAPPAATAASVSAVSRKSETSITPRTMTAAVNKGTLEHRAPQNQTATAKSASAETSKSATAVAAAAVTAKTAAMAAEAAAEEEFADLDDENSPRMNLISWDPRPVLEELYSVKLMQETAEDISHQFVSMEGLMEKLPMNKKKSTLLKTWKRRFFRAKDGWLQYFETGNRDKPSETLQLMGGHVDDMGNRILGIDDGRGHYLMVRAPTDKEHGQWKVALESQTADNSRATYVRPVLRSVPHATKKVVIIDLGSSSIRAGVLGEQESLPQVFFPSVVAIDKETGKKVVGMEAYHPDVRKNSTLLHPIRPSNRVDQFNIDVDMMSAIFSKVFKELGVNPSQFMVMLSTPQTLSDSLRAGLMNALVENLKVQGVCMVQQSLLALYSYRTTTGIIVDIGHRIEILPIYDGFVIEGGVSRCPYGSQKVIDTLKKALLQTNFKFASEVEMLLVQYIMQQSCYVAYNYEEEETLCETQPGKLQRTVNLQKFGLPEGAYRSVEVEEGRFSSPEGFFNVDLWEMDYPTLHKLIFQAIQSCPMDNRRHMYRAIYLSGGVTMLPGFQDRLLTELQKLAPSAVTVEVHSSPNRYHAAYLGACSVASMPQFKDMAITCDEWRKEGVRAFKKWQAPAS